MWSYFDKGGPVMWPLLALFDTGRHGHLLALVGAAPGDEAVLEAS